MTRVDLHLHTTSSDGVLSPKEVVESAAKKGLRAIAITDHDTTDGIEEAIYAGSEEGIEIIPGIEFSCIYKNEEIHILGYFIDKNYDGLKDIIEVLKLSRKERGRKMVEKLKKGGIDIDISEVLQKVKVGGNIGRPHIARVLIDKGIVTSVEDAFENYLIRGKMGYIERYKLSVEDAIDIIHRSGGVAVMAHPGLVRNSSYPKEILRYDFDGIEVTHSKHDESTERTYDHIAQKLNLIKTAGSDCHGVVKDGSIMLGEYTTGYETVKKLKKKSEEYGTKEK